MDQARRTAGVLEPMSTTPSRHAAGRLSSAPRVIAQAAQLRAMFGSAIQPAADASADHEHGALERKAAGPSFNTNGGVVQRILRTHESKGDEGTILESVGDKGYLAEYGRWLAQDSSVLVDGEPKGKPGLIKTLKETEINGEEVTEQLVESLISSGAWKDLNGPDKKSMVDYVVEEGSLMPKPTHDQDLDEYIADQDFDGSYQEHVSAWIREKLSALTGASTVGDVGNIPEKWHADLAYLLYEATKAEYYADDVIVNPYVPPFKELIGDVNGGKIEAFKFERKYGANNQNWGAEFTVDSPAELKDYYDDKAVLHTHYPSAEYAPSYAHTKPEAKKMESGFGYTVVKTDNVTHVSDTDKTWDELS